MTATLRPATIADPPSLADPTVQALALLRVGFTVAPILFGLDKFVEVMADWSTYLWPSVADAVSMSPDAVMRVVGVVEVAAGLLVAVRPRIGGLVVAAWLGGIIVNLLVVGGFLDVALRDLGLLLGALTLSRLASAVTAARAASGVSG